MTQPAHDADPKHASPIFITAPTARNGVTLLQRLLNSTRRCVIYAENVTLTHTLPSICHAEADAHRRLAADFRASRERFLTQGPEYWSSDLHPDHERFTALVFDAFHRAVDLYQRQSRADAFHRWGVKNPMRNPEMIQRLRVLLPRARFLVIHRDPFDVIRSAKARRFVRTLEDVRAFARQWSDHLAALLRDPRPDTLIIRHADLAADPAGWIARVERFTTLSGIDPGVLTTRINNFGSYVEPAELTPKEAQEVDRITADARRRAGYARADAA